MTVKTAIEIYEQKDVEGFDEYATEIDKWSSLWWSDFEEAEIERCYIAFDSDFPVAFQTVNQDGLCVAIEVKPEYQGKGIAGRLVDESGCYRPERDEFPEFWAAMAKRHA